MIAIYIILGLAIYSVTIGIVACICLHSRLYKSIVKKICTKDTYKLRAFNGAVILIAPVSIIIIILAYIAFGSYSVTKELIG